MPRLTFKIRLILALVLFLGGAILTIVNLYGLTKSIRVQGLSNLEPSQMRFKGDLPLSYEKAIEEIEGIQSLQNIDYIKEATRLVSKSLAHVEWLAVDPVELNQTIPVWENYFLWAMGTFSNLPFYERYHYVDYHRSLERGIGVCGDASMILSQLLDRKGIDNKIVALKGHVVVIAQSDEKDFYLDPDFGVLIEGKTEEISQDYKGIEDAYVSKGYTITDAYFIYDALRKPSREFDNVYAFISKRYIFEHATYFAKWPLPIFMILASVLICRLSRQYSKPNELA